MIAVLVFVVRVLLVLFIVRLVLRLIAQWRWPRVEGRDNAPSEVAMVRDRVCNTFLPRDRALRAVVNGREEHFCSPACRDRARQAAST